MLASVLQPLALQPAGRDLVLSSFSGARGISAIALFVHVYFQACAAARATARRQQSSEGPLGILSLGHSYARAHHKTPAIDQ